MARTIGLKIVLNGTEQVISDIETLESKILEARNTLKTLDIGSEEFQRLSNEINNTEAQLNNLNRSIETIDTEKFASGFSQLIGGLSAGFAGVTAAVNLFGEDVDEVSEAAADAQNLLTIALSIRGAAEIRTGAQIVARTIADKAATAATNATTTATRILYTTLSANPYGVIIAAVGALVSAYFLLQKETSETQKIQEEFNKTLDTDIAEGLAKLRILTSAAQDNTLSLKERTEAIKELQTTYPEYFGNLSKEKILNGDIAIEIDKAVEALKTKARAQASETQLVKTIQRELEIRSELRKERAKLTEEEKKALGFGKDLLKIIGGGLSNAIEVGKQYGTNEGLLRNINKLQEELNDNLDFQNELLDLNKKSLSGVGKNSEEVAKRLLLENNEYIRKILLLKQTYDEEVKAAEKLKDNEGLLLDLQKQYFIDRQNLIDDFFNSYIDFTNSTYLELGEITSNFYDNQERAITIEGNRQIQQLEQFQQAELFLLKKGSKEYNEVVVRQGKERELLEQLIQLKISDLRAKTTMEGEMAQLQIQQQAGDESIELQIKLYDKEFELQRDANIKKIKLAGQARGLTEEEIEKEIIAYNKLADKVKENGELRIKTSKEINKIDSNLTSEGLNIDAEYYQRKKELLEKYSKDEETLKQKLVDLDFEFKKKQIQNEINFLKEKLKVLEKDPTLNPEEYQRIKTRILQLEVDYATTTLENQQETSTKQLEKLQSDLLKGLEQFQNIVGQVASLFAQSYELQLSRLERDYQKTQNSIVGDTEEANQKRIEAEKIYQAERKEIEKEATIRSLQFQLLQGIADGAQAVLSTLENPILAAIVGGLAAVQIGVIQAQINEARALAGGGFIVRGNSHEYGGVMAGGGINLEGGEVVLNRNTSMDYLPLLSTLNQQGGGQPILNNPSNSLMEERLLQAIAKTRQEPIRAYVLSQEITNSQAINRRLDELSTL